MGLNFVHMVKENKIANNVVVLHFVFIKLKGVTVRLVEDLLSVITVKNGVIVDNVEEVHFVYITNGK